MLCRCPALGCNRTKACVSEQPIQAPGRGSLANGVRRAGLQSSLAQLKWERNECLGDDDVMRTNRRFWLMYGVLFQSLSHQSEGNTAGEHSEAQPV